MSRMVREINIATERPKDRETPRPFSDYAGRTNLVLLGDPGAGKTHLFKETAKVERAQFLTARKFLVVPFASLSAETIFIDALDEKRAGRGDRDTVDKLVEKLFAANPEKVRISCRVADWLGESDLAAFRPYFDQRGQPVVLLLESLSRDEQRLVLEGHGSDSATALTFLDEARERGLGEFLDNPQNVMMLWDAVKTTSWPKTRKDLFEKSTEFMLKETNLEHTRSGPGVYSARELRPAAGAICAARLISDVEAISLGNGEGTPAVPGYRSIEFPDLDKVQSVLGRRAFVPGPYPETVEYSHRTTAEYLAAEFLARRVRDGLPLGRVVALMGVDGHPAPELRGLHAWLTVHLPEHAEQLIDADPYGALTYGDAESLSASACACLIRALGSLAKTNPWFRPDSSGARSIGGLARPDMVGSFRAVLADSNAGFALRSVMLDALRFGAPLPELIPELVAVLGGQSPYVERLHALIALLRCGTDGEMSIVCTFRRQLDSTVDGRRLRAKIIHRLYGHGIDTEDVKKLLNECLEEDEPNATGMLWAIADSLPISVLPGLLDDVNIPIEDEGYFPSIKWEVVYFIGRSLVRLLLDPEEFDSPRAMNWILKWHMLKRGHGESDAPNLQLAMHEVPERIRAMASSFVWQMVMDENRWLKFARLREALRIGLSTKMLLDIVVEQLADRRHNTEKRLFLYEAGLGILSQADQPDADEMFQLLYEFGDVDTSYREVRERCLTLRLPEGYLDRKLDVCTADLDADRTKQRQDFEQNAPLILAGAHLGWLAHLAQIYFALYYNVDQSQTPRERLATRIGEENVDTALAGLKATVSRNNIPTLAEIVEQIAERRHYDWWYALVAGLNERWTLDPTFVGLSDDSLAAITAFDLANPVGSSQNGTSRWLAHPWKEALLVERPRLVLDTYVTVVREGLTRNDQRPYGLQELITDAIFEPFRKDVVIELLRDFPNLHPIHLGDLLDAVAKLPKAHAEFLALAERVLSGNIEIDEQQRNMWLATAYLFSPSQYGREIEEQSRSCVEIVFDLRARSNAAFRSQDRQLPLPVLETMARLTGAVYPDTPYPSHAFWGDNNPWDAAAHCRSLIDLISILPSEAATLALARLESNAELSSYGPYILSALANQRQVRRDAEYDRPDWSGTVRTLNSGAPATVADLHALVGEHLRDLKVRIERENIDIYKQFWNLDAFERPTSPRPEGASRDVLVELMRPRLYPLNVTVEPEAHMVADKRADISVAMPGRKILCELKRDYHAEVWVAMEKQLDRFYAHDPEAKGFGIYCVFWYGEKRPHSLPNPPNGLNRPRSAEEMEQMLRTVLPERMMGRITILVINVSGYAASSAA